jgi:ornithine cyclodeaminase
MGIDVVGAAELRRLLPYPELISEIGRVLVERPVAAPRAVLATAHREWGVMPIAADDGGLVCKLVGQPRAGASARGLAGMVVVLDRDGAVRLLLDATELTVRRTAAVTAYGTGRLAAGSAGTVALFGTGALARPHIDALRCVRTIREVRVVGRTPAASRALAESLQAGSVAARAATADEALRGADIVVCVTSAHQPVFRDDQLEDGAHVNAIGGHGPQRREVPAETVARARDAIVVDAPDQAWTEAGELIHARTAGLIDPRALIDLGDSDRVGALRRADPQRVTLLRCVGHASADLAAVRVVLREIGDRPASRPA